MPVVGPRVVGIEVIKGETFAWTGGGSIVTTRRMKPQSMKPHRPQDLKSKSKMETTCQEGLAASHRLSTSDKIATDATAVSFQTWIERFKASLEAKGMDSIFRMETEVGSEHYLLDKFGRADNANVKAWVSDWHVKGCEYDEKIMTGKKAESDLPTNRSEPEVYAVMVDLYQSQNTSDVRVLTEQLQELKLSKEAGENVETFADKVTDIAKRIQGAGPDTCPKDLPMLVYECFQESTTPVFALEATGLLHKASKGDPTVEDWEANESGHKSSYRALITRKGWQASKYHQEKVEVQALQAQVNSLLKTMADDFSKTGEAKPPHADNGGSADARECYHCGEHKDKPKVVKAGANAQPAANANAATDPGRKTAPKDGEPHTKKVDGVDCKVWCDTCKRWNKGEKAHLTAEHVKEKGKMTAPKAAGALAADDDNDAGATLRFVSGIMAKRSMPSKRDVHDYCGDYMIVVPKGERHSETPLHLASKCRKDLVGLQCKCEKKRDEACEWTQTQVTYTKIGSLKDQAGHP